MTTNCQARLLGIKSFHVKVISDNTSSVRLHEKCGFRRTGTVPWDGYEDLLDYLNESDEKPVNRQIIKMVVELKDR